MSYIDLHSHPLPGLDDGPATFGQSLALIEAAWRSGTQRMVATPHMFQEGLGSDDIDEVAALFADFQVAVEDYREAADHTDLAGFELVLGAENYVGESFFAALDQERVLPLGVGRYLLIEYWPAITRSAARQAIGAVQDAGFTPVLAHVERYGFLQNEPSLLAELVAGGCVVQINAAAILGLQGLGVAQLADRWLRQGLVGVVASDGHNTGRRKPDLDAVDEHLRSRYGASLAEQCLRLNPEAILADQPITLAEPRRQRWWRRDR